VLVAPVISASLVESRCEEWDGQGSLVAYVVSKNLHRRHLTKTQNATVAVDMLPLLEEEARERMAQGGMKALEVRGVIERTDITREGEVENVVSPGVAKMPHLGKSRDQAAEMVGASARYVTDAKRVKKEAPEAFEGLRAGTVTMRQGLAIASRAAV